MDSWVVSPILYRVRYRATRPVAEWNVFTRVRKAYDIIKNYTFFPRIELTYFIQDVQKNNIATFFVRVDIFSFNAYYIIMPFSCQKTGNKHLELRYEKARIDTEELLMDMNMIHTLLADAMRTPLIFLMYVALGFAVVVLIGCVILYCVFCAVNKKTAMTGLMQVSVAVNRLPDDTAETKSPMLNMGTYYIGMQDPAKIRKKRLDPKLYGLRAAQCRRYSISALLERFRIAFDAAGFSGDPASDLLQSLLHDDIFCQELGQISRKNARRGLEAHTAAFSKYEGKTKDSISIFYTIPEKNSADFCNALGCDAKTLCITLDYGVR